MTYFRIDDLSEHTCDIVHFYLEYLQIINWWKVKLTIFDLSKESIHFLANLTISWQCRNYLWGWGTKSWNGTPGPGKGGQEVKMLHHSSGTGQNGTPSPGKGGQEVKMLLLPSETGAFSCRKHVRNSYFAPPGTPLFPDSTCPLGHKKTKTKKLFYGPTDLPSK